MGAPDRCRGTGTVHSAPDVGGGVAARCAVEPDRGDTSSVPARAGLHRRPAGRGGRSLPGCARRRGAQRRRRARRRAARARATDRRSRNPGGAASRHCCSRRTPSDGLGHQRRTGAHSCAARRVRHRRTHGGTSGVLDPQRASLGRDHRNARATVALRTVLRADRRHRGCRAEKQTTGRRRVLTHVRPGSGGGRLPYAASGGRGGHRGAVGRCGGPRRGLGARDGRRDPGAAGRLGGGSDRALRRGRPMDPGPRTRRHPDPGDRASDPRSRCGHCGGSDPRRPTQPVHRRRCAGGG